MMCPTCNQPMPDEAISFKALLLIVPSGAKHMILKSLIDNFPDPVLTRNLVSVVYGHRRDGGPTSADNQIRISVFQLRQRLELTGWDISNSYSSGGNGGYRLVLNTAGGGRI